MTTINAMFLEFENVAVDLRHIKFSQNDNSQNSEYIIFLNVKKAIYSNFNLKTDFSLETLTMYIYENVVLNIDEKPQTFDISFEKLIFNDWDDNNSIIIDLATDARIIVARALRPGEKYHQHVSGYLDFERRHLNDVRRLSDSERAHINRLYGTILLDNS